MAFYINTFLNSLPLSDSNILTWFSEALTDRERERDGNEWSWCRSSLQSSNRWRGFQRFQGPQNWLDQGPNYWSFPFPLFYFHSISVLRKPTNAIGDLQLLGVYIDLNFGRCSSLFVGFTSVFELDIALFRRLLLGLASCQFGFGDGPGSKIAQNYEF